MKLGLLGKNISYSFSEEYFSKKFIKLNLPLYSYSLFDISNKSEIINLFHMGLSGFNVTIPYKQDIISFLDEVSPEAQKIGAINTVKIINGKRYGYNTDVIGFRNSLKPLLEDYHKSALILGNGGASKAVSYVLKELGIPFTIISRKGPNNYKSLSLEIIRRNLLIINTTPVGTFPNLKDYPLIPVDFLTQKHLIYDLIYNPEKTRLLELAENKGAKIKNGLEMLHLQAEAAWEIWNS